MLNSFGQIIRILSVTSVLIIAVHTFSLENRTMVLILTVPYHCLSLTLHKDILIFFLF